MERVLIDIVDDGPAGWLVTLTHRRAAGAGGDVVLFEDVPMLAVQVTIEMRAIMRPVTLKVPAPLAGLTAEELRQLLQTVEDASAADGDSSAVDAAAYGCWLHRALFGADRQRWVPIEAIGAAGDGLELALRWAPSDFALHRLLWEAMFDPPPADAAAGAVPEPLAGMGWTRPLVAITRIVAGKLPARELPYRGVPRVLFAVGSTFDDPEVRPGAMLLGLLRALDAEGLCTSRVRLGIDRKGLEDEVARFDPHIVHVVAHGRMDPVNGDVTVKMGRNDQLNAAQLRQAVGNPLVVVLSVCESGHAGTQQASLAAWLVADGIPVVAAMAGRVGVSACRLFVRKLVEALSGGTGMVAASAEGRRAALLDAGVEPDLDWALPTMFLSDAIDPSSSIIDVEPARTAQGVSVDLALSRTPPFVGRDDILVLADQMLDQRLDDRRRSGFMAITNEGSLTGLGSTALLCAIGCRAVRAGHVPIMLSMSNAEVPKTFAQLVVDLFRKIKEVRDRLSLPLRWPALLGAAPEAIDHGIVSRALTERRDGDDPDPEDVRAALVTELNQLLAEVQARPAPFGVHSQVIVLGDDVHSWGGLESLLDMVGAGGIGSWTSSNPAGLRVPVIVTADLTTFSGMALKAAQPELTQDRAKGVFVDLRPFEAVEAIVAYNWTLLHRWPQLPGYSAAEGVAVVAKSAADAVTWDKMLLAFMHPQNPGAITQMYRLAWTMLNTNQFIRRIDEDDDRALKTIAEHQR
jgi:hypothetical protein